MSTTSQSHWRPPATHLDAIFSVRPRRALRRARAARLVPRKQQAASVAAASPTPPQMKARRVFYCWYRCNGVVTTTERKRTGRGEKDDEKRFRAAGRRARREGNAWLQATSRSAAARPHGALRSAFACTCAADKRRRARCDSRCCRAHASQRPAARRAREKCARRTRSNAGRSEASRGGSSVGAHSSPSTSRSWERVMGGLEEGQGETGRKAECSCLCASC